MHWLASLFQHQTPRPTSYHEIKAWATKLHTKKGLILQRLLDELCNESLSEHLRTTGLGQDAYGLDCLLSRAVANRQPDVVMTLLHQGADPNAGIHPSDCRPLALYSDNARVLEKAIKNGDTLIVAILLGFGAHPMYPVPPYSCSPARNALLKQAVDLRYTGVVTLLIRHGADPAPVFDALPGFAREERCVWADAMGHLITALPSGLVTTVPVPLQREVGPTREEMQDHHLLMKFNTMEIPEAPRCGSCTQRGTACRNRVTYDGDSCWRHS